MKNLYQLTTKGLGDFYIIATSADAAISQLEMELNNSDYGFTSDRSIVSISILANELTCDFQEGRLNFSSKKKLIIC